MTKTLNELEERIVQQIEFYFGDINLSRDKFLRFKLKEDDGWISFDVLMTFNRLKAISSDKDVIVAAIKKASSGLLQVNEDDSKVRRSPEIPLAEFTDERRADLMKRSVYVKGFPLDSTLDALQAFFNDFGKTEYVQMRRNEKKTFKGSVFVVFNTTNDAESFLKSEKGATFKEEPLIRLFKQDYFKSKNEQRKNQKIAKKEAKPKNVELDAEKQQETFMAEAPKGAILVLEDLPEEVSRIKLKEIVNPLGQVAWVGCFPGETTARVRFEKENGAIDALEKLMAANDGVVKIADKEVKARVLEGEEEREHWLDCFNKKKESNVKKSYGGKRGRSKNYRSERRDRSDKSSNKRDAEGGEPQPKKVKTTEDE